MSHNLPNDPTVFLYDKKVKQIQIQHKVTSEKRNALVDWIRTSEKKVGICASHLLAKFASHVVSVRVFFDSRWQLHSVKRRANISAICPLMSYCHSWWRMVEDCHALLENSFVCQRMLFSRLQSDASLSLKALSRLQREDAKQSWSKSR